MIRRLALSVVALAVLAGVALGLAALSPLRKPAPEAVDLPRTTRLTCAAAGQVLVDAAGEVSVAPLDGDGQSLQAPGQVAAEGPVRIVATQEVTASILVDSPQRALAPCAAPVTAGMVLVADPAATELVLVNSDAGEAAVDLTLLGPDGEISAVGARGIAIAPGVTRRVALSVLAPTGPVGVVFRASQGRVALLATAVEGRPARFAAPATTATEHLLPVAAAGATATELLVSNPGQERVDIALEGLGPEGPYVPAISDGLSVAPLSTVRIALTGPLAGEATAIRVTASSPVGAALQTTAGGQAATVVAGEPAAELRGVVPGAGALHLSNPDHAEAVTATVTLTALGGSATSADVEVPVGSTVSVPLPAGDPVSVSVAADGALLAAASSATPAGTVVAPLTPRGEGEDAAVPAVLEPGLR